MGSNAKSAVLVRIVAAALQVGAAPAHAHPATAEVTDAWVEHYTTREDRLQIATDYVFAPL